MVGFSIIMPILPYYAESMGASATELGLLTATYATLQFFFAPMWGRISDRVGRKPVLLLGLFGFTFTFIGFGLSTELWMLFASRTISGLLTSATLPTVMAFIADTTEREQRGVGMSQLGAAMGLGTIFGPVLGGLLGTFSPSTPFFVAAGLGFAVAVFATIFLPESLSPQMRAAAKISDKPRKSGIVSIFSMLGGPLAILLILALLISFAMAQLESTSALFYERKFSAGEAELGMIFMVMGVVSFLTQMFLVGRVINWLGEERTIQFSLVGGTFSFLLYPLINSLVSAMAVVSLMGLITSFMRPALNSIISKRTPADEQGVTMGVTNSYYSLGRMFGPVTGGLIFDYLGLNGPFLFASGIMALGIGLSFILLGKRMQLQTSTSTHQAGE